MKEKESLVKANTNLNLLLSPTEPVVTIKPGPAVWIYSACHNTETLEFTMGKLVYLLGVGNITVHMDVSCVLTALMSPCQALF